MTDEYVSVPKLAVLAEELSVLNKKLIAEGIPFSIRLLRLREYANTAQAVSPSGAGVFSGNNTLSCWSPTIAEDAEGRYFVTFRGEKLGPFATSTLARAAHREAHLAHYGTASAYHPSCPAIARHLARSYDPASKKPEMVE